MVVDIIVLSVILIFIIIGIKRGIAITLLNLAGVILCAISAYYLSELLAQSFYDAFLKQTIITNVENIIEQNGLEYAVQNPFEAMPQWILSVLSLLLMIFGITIDEFEKNMAFSKDISLTIAQNIEITLNGLVISIFMIILVIILFIVLFFLIKKIIKLALNVFEIPVIKQINKLLGGLFGAIEGIVIIWFAINIFYAIIAFTSPDIIQNDAITGEVFKLFCLGS